MKKWISLLLCALLAIGMAACTITPTPETPVQTPAESPDSQAAQDGAFVAGTYQATATGHNGDFTVTVEFSKDKIERIDLGDHKESQYLGSHAMDLICEQILANQSVDVDTIAGATVSTAAVRAAVSSAVEQAGANPGDMPAPAAPSDVWEDVTTQVVIIGGGSAGLCAVVEANELGLDAILVEQLGILGGSSVRAAYLQAGGTRLQAENNIAYSVDDYKSFLADASQAGFGKGNHDEAGAGLFQQDTAVRIAEMAGENIDWLQDLGAPITVTHNIFWGNGNRIGPYLVETMAQTIQDRGIDCRLNTRANEVIMENGTAVGVQVEAPDGSFYNIYADAVVLATGGYNASQDMISQYNPKYKGAPTDCSKGSDGSGMLMGEKAGGVLAYMDVGNYHPFALMWRGACRSLATVIDQGAIAVNAEGKRFVNEDTRYGEACCDAVMAQTGGTCYVIMDQSTAERMLAPESANTANLECMYEVAQSPEELAEKLGIDPEGLAKTIQTYGTYAKNGEDTELGRSAKTMAANFEAGPYYGVRSTINLHTNHGGLVIDIDTHVLDKENQPIPGLYAAGEVAATHIAGATTLTLSVAQGRIAARSIQAALQN